MIRARLSSHAVILLLALALVGGVNAAPPKVDLPERLSATQPNTWVMLDVGGYGQRNSVGLVYLPEETRFVLLGGAYADTARYSEQTLDLAAGRWENRFPMTKVGEWGDVAGPASAPEFDRSSAFKDKQGTCRPNLAFGYNHRMELWGNCAFDQARGKIVVPWHILKKTSEYDVKTNTWQLIDSADDAPGEFWDDCVFGSMAYDPVNKEVLTGQCRWAWRNGKWERQSFGSKQINELRGSAERARALARYLLGLCRARFYDTQSEAMAKITLEYPVLCGVAPLAKDLAAEITAVAAKAAGYEKTQLGWADEDAKRAVELIAAVGGLGQEKLTAEHIRTAEDIWESLDRVVDDLSSAPPRRAYSGLTTDFKRGKLVLFGGHRLDRLVADTWVYDCATRTWEQRRPKLSPAPRYGHGLTWLPESGKVLLIDGSGYGPAGQTWVYDLDANEWNLLAEGGAGARLCLTTYASTWGWQPEPAAAGAGDVAITLCNINREGRGDPIRFSTWAARIDATRIDAAGYRQVWSAARHGHARRRQERRPAVVRAERRHDRPSDAAGVDRQIAG